MGSSYWFDTINCPVYISRGVSYNFKENIVFFRLKNLFTITNSEDPDEMHHYAAFHLELHCLEKYLFRGFQYIKG